MGGLRDPPETCISEHATRAGRNHKEKHSRWLLLCRRRARSCSPARPLIDLLVLLPSGEWVPPLLLL